MADFKTSHSVVMANEGGYSNILEDSGGETYAGVSRKNFPSWPGWDYIDTIKRVQGNVPSTVDRYAKANQGLQAAVLSFYKAQFWDKLKLDQVGVQSIATELYDTAVNMGLGTAGMFLQRSMNASEGAGLTVDGQVGDKTIAALNASAQPGNVLKVLNCLQGAKYVSIIEANPSQKRFFKSWFSRVTL